MVYSGHKGLQIEDTLDEYFEYEAEEFLVNLALLITEGRTPEYSVKGRTEGFHCPPAQSGQPVTTKHECSDKLSQCRQARRTRSEVTLLWKNNIPIMVEVMLLPDCCYSDEGPPTEGNDLNDPAVKQDALLLERWILEPGSPLFKCFIELLHTDPQFYAIFLYSGVIMPNLQWTFPQITSPSIFFPRSNVSHNVSLKVQAVQSLSRQSNPPASLTCSIHTNLGFYEKRVEGHGGHQHCESEQCNTPASQRLCGERLWTEGVPSATAPELGTGVRTLKLFPSAGLGSDFRAPECRLPCYTTTVESKKLSQETSERALKPSADSRNGFSSHHSFGDSIPLIGSLLQERHEVIARIAQHLIHCDPATSPVTGRPFNANETGLVTPRKAKFRQSLKKSEGLLRKGKELFSGSAANSELASPENNYVGKARMIPETPFSNPQSPVIQRSRQTIEEANPLISSLLQERQEVIARIAQHLIHCDPPTSHVPHPVFNVHEISSVNSKGFQSSREDDSLPKKGRDSLSDSFSPSRLSSLEDNLKAKGKIPATPPSSFRCGTELKVSPKPQERRIVIAFYGAPTASAKTLKQRKYLLTETPSSRNSKTNYEIQKCLQKKPVEDGSAPCEQKRNGEVLRTIPLKQVWRRNHFFPFDGSPTKAFHPRTGLPLLSSPIPERKTRSGCFDLDASLLQLKCLSSKSPQHCLSKENDPDAHEKPFLSSSAPPVTSLSLLGNFEESVLNYRLDPLGIVDGFTAEVGASGMFCPTHMTLPVEVSFYSVSDDNAPSPYMGVIALESLGKRGYRVPPSGTIQVTLFNPNKTVVKMFVVIYDLREMPANHQTFLRQRTFSVPVRRETKRSILKENTRRSEERLLRYLIHLRFQSSKSGKIYLYRDVRLLFSRKSMEVDSGAAYELKSYTESPTNPQFSPRC
ncbi:LOW QUALITY PROTEIN: protein FAM214A [Sphaerodactylus townsendi]|uniref:LOW QUALITY PROTEIN: protein FAM214A n=1 Tax=Sphaerodactylus townsendi TaxID=933632 RepID=UPI002026F4F7|nr:LOW QUALITY PROTEIN: protein FAM214A [Sphaerodactylus townsendi]